MPLDESKRELLENNISDVEMSPCDNVGMSEDEDDDELDDDKSTLGISFLLFSL